MRLSTKPKPSSWLLMPRRSKSLSLTCLREKFGEAAEILYEILNNLTVLSTKVPIAVVCNKQDL